MTTLQAALVALFQAVTSVLPLGENAHAFLLTEVLGWPAPDSHQILSAQAGILLAVLFLMRHEVASALSGILKMVFTFSRARTADEHLGLAVLGSALPFMALRFFSPESSLHNTLLLVVAVLLALTLILQGTARTGRRNKSAINWNLLDGLFVGLCSLCAALPGGGRTEGALAGAFLRNYDLASTLRFSFLSLIPFHLLRMRDTLLVTENLPFPGGLSERLSLGVGFVVALFATGLAVGAALRAREFSVQKIGLYRIVLGLTLLGWWIRQQAL